MFTEYTGECFNSTIGLSANIVLRIGIMDNRIVGELEISGEDLEGGGAIKGMAIDGYISFMTPDNSEFYPILWSGVLSEDAKSIEGLYIVESKNDLYPSQNGTWTVSLR